MKNELLSKLVRNSIPIPNIIQKEKKKSKNKNYNNSHSKDKILIKNKIDYKNKTMSTIKKNKLNIEIEEGNHTAQKINRKLLSKELTDVSNHKEVNNFKKSNKTLIKHKTSSNINNSYNIKTTSKIFNKNKNRKSTKINISNFKIPKNNDEKLYISAYSNKKENSILNSYNKPKIENKIYNNVIKEFIENKIDINTKKQSFDCINKIKKVSIFLIDNHSNSSPLLIIKNNNNKYYRRFKSNKLKLKKIIQMDESIKESSFLIEQKNLFKKKKYQKNIKDKNNNNNRKSLYTSNNKTSISKNKKEDKPLKKLKKQTIFYQKKLSSSSINKNHDIKSFLINKQELKKKERIETEPKKDNLTTIEENGKFNKKCFNFLHHYLQNTVSRKNKIVIKRKEEKSKNNSIQKSKSLIKRKRYSFINRNSEFKFEKILKAKENLTNLTNIRKKQDNSIKRVTSSNKKGKLYNTPILTKTSSTQNIKEFNGSIENYLITKELGKGSYATVKLAINKTNKNKYAIKIYPRESLIDPQKRNTIKNEIDILKQLDFVNIMKLYEMIDTPKYLYLVMEYINGISLLETIKRDKNHYFEENRAINIFIQVVKGMIYCQSKNICHRDIKLENILIIKNDIIKIIDFGFAVKTNKETYQKLFCGTPSYMSPEIVNKEKYIAQYSDIWSLGILFFAMLYGRFPFRGKNQEELFKKINEANIIFPEDIEISEQIKVLIKKILITIPTQRLSLNEILNELIHISDN